MSDWKIYIRDRELRRVGEVDDFEKMEIVKKFNDVGTFQLDIDRRSRSALMLSTPGYGIYVVHVDTGTVLLSGAILGQIWDRAEGGDTLKLTGADDNILLARRVSHPSPTETAPPYDVASHHEVSGTASTVLRAYVDANLGPGAIPTRREPHVRLAAVDPQVGTSVSGKVRWGNLLEDLRLLAIAGGDLRFECVQHPEDATIRFEVYEPQDKTDTIVFSEGLGNLAKYSYDLDAPETTYVYVGGQGEMTARTIAEYANPEAIADWYRAEEFADRRDTDDAEELKEKALEVLAEKGLKASLRVEPIDTPNMAYAVHYDLGDRVTVSLAGAEHPSAVGTDTTLSIQDSIREVTLTAEPETAFRVTPQIGTVGRNDVLKIFRQARDLLSRVRNLETR